MQISLWRRLWTCCNRLHDDDDGDDDDDCDDDDDDDDDNGWRCNTKMCRAKRILVPIDILCRLYGKLRCRRVLGAFT